MLRSKHRHWHMVTNFVKWLTWFLKKKKKKGQAALRGSTSQALFPIGRLDENIICWRQQDLAPWMSAMLCRLVSGLDNSQGHILFTNQTVLLLIIKILTQTSIKKFYKGHFILAFYSLLPLFEASAATNSFNFSTASIYTI